LAKAKKIPGLDVNKPLSECLKVILPVRFSEMTEHEQGTLEGSDIEALHDMRVASRRVQAVFKMFRSVFPKKKFKTEYAELKMLISALGVVRDCDVFIDKLKKLKASQPAGDTRAFDLLIIRKQAEREEKRRVLAEHISMLNKAGYKEHFHGFVYENL